MKLAGVGAFAEDVNAKRDVIRRRVAQEVIDAKRHSRAADFKICMKRSHSLRRGMHVAQPQPSQV